MSGEKVRVIRKKPEDIFTYIAWLMDRSGSMQGIKEAAVGGYTLFVHDQQALPGKAVFTVAQFDNEFEILQRNAPLSEAFEYTAATYIPRGSTRLLDSIGRLMAVVEEDISAMEQKPDVVVLGVMTDGQENASREFSHASIKERISEWEGKGWKVQFLSSEPATIEMAHRHLGVGMADLKGFDYSAHGVKSAFAGYSSNLTSMRSGMNSHLHSDEDPK
jgi:hypothetical protein